MSCGSSLWCLGLVCSIIVVVPDHTHLLFGFRFGHEMYLSSPNVSMALTAVRSKADSVVFFFIVIWYLCVCHSVFFEF